VTLSNTTTKSLLFLNLNKSLDDLLAIAGFSDRYLKQEILLVIIPFTHADLE
jgi:hypothetical protein